MSEPSTKPYLIRAIHEWCVDQGFTPYLAVSVNQDTLVPRAFVKGGEIVLNASPLATNHLQLGNDWIEFQARFSGVVQDIRVPVGQVSAIYARENGHGMAFEVSKPLAEPALAEVDASDSEQTAWIPVVGPAGPDSGPVMVQPVADSQKNEEKTPKSSTEKRKSHLTRIK